MVQAVKTKDFECHFTFQTVVQTNGRDEEGAIENIEKRLPQAFIEQVERMMGCGIDFDADQIEAKEIENGWFELVLPWFGSWLIDGIDETTARKTAEELLDERLTPFYQMIENESIKQRRLVFIRLQNIKVTDVLEY